MSERRLLVPRLRALDHDLAARGMPPWVERRIAAALAAEAARRERGLPRARWGSALAFVAGAAIVSIVVGRSDRLPPTARVVVGFSVDGDDCRVGDDTDMLRVSGECRVERPGFRLRTWGDSELATADDGLALSRGRVLFQVDHVAPGDPPVRVHVSHGTIEVLGTRFVVDQQAGEGDVELLEGSIRFVGLDGSTHELRPGDRHAWGAAERAPVALAMPAVAPVVVPPQVEVTVEDEDIVEVREPVVPRPRATSGRATTRRDVAPRRDAPGAAPKPVGESGGSARLDPTGVIAEVAELRRLGHWRKAVAVLETALARPYDRRTREVLSFELGDIVGRHLHDQAAACEQFRRHAERFPQGRYAGAVQRALAKCDAP